MRVFQAGNRASFSEVHFGVFGPGQPIGVGHLDGHGAIQLFVLSQIDEAETPFTQEPLDPVAADFPGRALLGGLLRPCAAP